MATGNTVVLDAGLGSTALENVALWGGKASRSSTQSEAPCDAVTGNTLKVRANGLTVKEIANFEKHIFAAGALSAGSPILSLNAQGTVLTIAADNVSIEADKPLSVGVGESAALLKITDDTGTISLDRSVSKSMNLDGEAGGLPLAKYTLSAPDTKTLGVTVNELYLYGSGGANSEGQRERNNTLTLDASTPKATAAFGGCAASGDVTANTLIVDAPATLAEGAYGGYADQGSATGNTVVLTENLTGKSLDFPLYGGYSGSGGEAVTGNTLEVRSKSLNVRSVGNFENYSFILPKGIAGGDTVLTVRGGQPTTFARKANIGVVVASGAKLNKGDTVTLIKNSAGFAGEGYRKAAMNGVTLKGGQGVSLEYDFELSDTPTTIDATVVNGNSKNGDSGTGARVREETKSMVEARAAAVGIANAGADLVAGQAMHNALSGTSAAQRGMSAGDGADGFAIAPFFALTGGTQRLESGSYVDVHGVAAVLGLAARKNFNAVALTGGLFFEYGTSRFNTHNSFDAGDVDGTGRASYTGGGLLARIDLADTLLKGLYFEGAFRFGGMESDWQTDDLRDAVTGRRASYEISFPYHGAHLGLGHIWQATDTFKVDLYGKWLWTHVHGDDVRVANDPYEFDDVDSYRLRIGARADWNITEQIGVYAGAAWEHAFDGKARATAYGLDTPAPSIEGDTGVFDLGVSFKPGAIPNLTLELGASAAAGVRHGISGNMMVKYEF